MQITNQWERIKEVFIKSYHSSLHFSIATVSEDGTPSIAPVGGLFLKEKGEGFFFDIFFNKTKENLGSNAKVCVMAVNCSKLFWLKSLLKGTFKTPPAVRLYGIVGERRKATEDEQLKFRRRLHKAKKFKGYKLLWKDLDYVRDIKFSSFEPVLVGEMTKKLW